MKTTTYNTLVNNFIEDMEYYDETFTSTGDPYNDYAIIKDRIERQGYWCGIYNRYYLDENYHVRGIEGRF